MRRPRARELKHTRSQLSTMIKAQIPVIISQFGLSTRDSLSRDFNSVMFSPDGRYLAGNDDEHRLRIWDARTYHPLKGHANWVMSVVLIPTGRNVRRILWCLARGKRAVWAIENHSNTTKRMVQTLPNVRKSAVVEWETWKSRWEYWLRSRMSSVLFDSHRSPRMQEKTGRTMLLLLWRSFV